MTRPDPLLPTLVLQSEEKAWLNVAWATSSTSEQRDAEIQQLAEWIAGLMPDDFLDKHPNTQDYRAGIQLVALVTGRVAGARGFDDDTAMKLYAAVNGALRAKE